MTRSNRHRIQRQILELTIGATAESPAVHHALARPFWDRAVPELERVFDRVAGPGELLRLDRLELNLGTIAGGEWPAEFRRRLVAELTRTLAQYTAVSEPGKHGRADGQPAEACRQFLFFLAHGRLPWWATAPVENWNAVLSNLADADWSALRETALCDPGARSRLVYSAGDELLEQAIARWSGAPEAALVLDRLAPMLLAGDARRQWRRGFWTLVLDWVSGGRFHSPQAGAHLLRELMILRDLCDAGAGRPHRFDAAPDEASRSDRAAPVEDRDLPEPWRQWYLAHDAAPFERAVAERPSGADERNARASGESARTARAPERPRREIEDHAIYLPGAGVILVHPFLEQLFRERGLLERRSFRSLEARHRAVRLIGFITFGRLDVPEYELVLAKALCGVELEEPIEPEQLEDEDVAACGALLGAVLNHWTALRSSSPQWLREQFFLREGKLEAVDSGWLLTIERHAQDVLLARLPWGFGVVAPPWMKARVFVSWLD